MLDARMRTLLGPGLDRAAAVLDRSWVTPDRLTLLGLVSGLASAGTAAAQLWGWSLGLWLLSRLLDGLDGPLARRRRRAVDGHGVDDGGEYRDGAGESTAGGFLDITADFLVYGATVLGVAVGVTRGEGAAWEPFAAVLLAYYVNGTAFLAYSSAAERSGRRVDDGRSFSFLTGLAEGTETVLVHSVWLLLPAHAELVAAVWAVVVGLSAVQRVVTGHRLLRSPPP